MGKKTPNSDAPKDRAEVARLGGNKKEKRNVKKKEKAKQKRTV